MDRDYSMYPPDWQDYEEWGEDEMVGLPDEPPIEPPGGYLCVVCHQNWVDAANGFDTCDDCLSKM